MRSLNPLSLAVFTLLHASYATAALTVYNAQATSAAGYDATQVSGLVSTVDPRDLDGIALNHVLAKF